MVQIAQNIMPGLIFTFGLNPDGKRDVDVMSSTGILASRSLTLNFFLLLDSSWLVVVDEADEVELARLRLVVDVVVVVVDLPKALDKCRTLYDHKYVVLQ